MLDVERVVLARDFRVELEGVIWSLFIQGLDRLLDNIHFEMCSLTIINKAVINEIGVFLLYLIIKIISSPMVNLPIV
jgi:hypothetical protein